MIIGHFDKVTIPLSSIEKIIRKGQWIDKTLTVYTKDGESFDYKEASVVAALKNTIQASFPSNGAQMIEYWVDEDGSLIFDLTSVLGFVIDARGRLNAVTVSGSYDEPTILFPDGHVEKFEERWDSMDEYKRELTTKNTSSE